MGAWSTLPADHESSLSHPGPCQIPSPALQITSGPIKTANIGPNHMLRTDSVVSDSLCLLSFTGLAC
jgi:hypothetical protein